MNAPPGPAPVKLLALARLLAAPRGETRARMSKDLEPLVVGLRPEARWDDRLDRILDECEAGGLIDRARDKKGKPTARLALTDQGRRVALEALGVEDLPARMTWKALCSTHLTALALGHPGPGAALLRSLAGAPGLRAAILRAKFALDPETPAGKVAEAAAAKLLGLVPGQKFSKDAILAKLLRDAGLDLPDRAKGGLTAADIQAALFRRELGDRGPAAGNPLEALAARAVGAAKSTAPELSGAVLRAWVDRSEGTADAIGDVPPGHEGRGPAEIGLEDFARRVVEAARESPTGRFGDAKVFISHVRRSLGDDPAFRGMDDASFKRRLVEAHRVRLLELGRADLVEAMDPSDVSESATPYLTAVYHFVRTEETAG